MVVLLLGLWGVSTRSVPGAVSKPATSTAAGLAANAPTSNDAVNHAHSGSRSPAGRFAELATSPISSVPEVTVPPRSSLIRLRVSEAREDVVCLKPSAACCAACRAVSASDDVGPVLAARIVRHELRSRRPWGFSLDDAPFPDLAPPAGARLRPRGLFVLHMNLLLADQ
jgi:hypothetical protein